MILTTPPYPQSGSRLAALLISTLLGGCAASTYSAHGNHPQLVLPKRGWIRPNTSGKQAFDDIQLCAAESEKDPQLQALTKAANDLHVLWGEGTKEQDKILVAPLQYQGSWMGQCLRGKGYKRGKLRPDQVYIPPLPPKWDWVKPGISSDEKSRIQFQCNSQHYNMDQRSKCMTDQGFQWQIVDPHPSSPFD